MTSQCGATKSSCLDLKGSEGRSQPQGTLWDQQRSHLGGIVVGPPLPLLPSSPVYRAALRQ